MRAAIYARVSTEKQEQEQTVQSQLADLRLRLQEDGAGPAEEFIDEGYSRDDLVRPGLDRLRSLAASKDVSTVYIHSPDRLASGVELMVVWDELKAAGTEVIFLRGDVESNAEGRVFMHMQGAFAEYEKTKIAERTRRGKKHWAEQHALVSFWEPYGYNFVKRTAEHRAHLVVVEERAAVVRNVFDWTVSKHLSQRAVAVRLTEQGVATSKGANQWQPAVIGFMLRNQIYKGVLKYNRAISDESDAGLTAGWEDPALAIVDDETWAKAQQQLKANQRYAGRNNKRHRYLLRGLIKCPRCGGAYTGAADHGTRRYRCYREDSRVSSTGQKCAPGSIKAGPLEQAVWDAVTEALSDQTLLREQFAEHINSSVDPENREQDLKQIKLALKHVERQQKRLLDAYLNEAFDMDRLKDEGDRLDARKESLLADRKLLHYAQVTSEAMDRSTTEFDGFLAEIAVGLEALTFEERQKVLRLIVEKITYENGKARVEIVIPPAPVESEGATAKLHNRLPEPVEGRPAYAVAVAWARNAGKVPFERPQETFPRVNR